MGRNLCKMSGKATLRYLAMVFMTFGIFLVTFTLVAQEFMMKGHYNRVKYYLIEQRNVPAFFVDMLVFGSISGLLIPACFQLYSLGMFGSVGVKGRRDTYSAHMGVRGGVESLCDSAMLLVGLALRFGMGFSWVRFGFTK